MKKVLTAIVMVAILALFIGTGMAGTPCPGCPPGPPPHPAKKVIKMKVGAYVPQVFDIKPINTVSCFGPLIPKKQVGPVGPAGNKWIYAKKPLSFSVRTNRDYTIKLVDIGYLKTNWDKLGGGMKPLIDDRYHKTNPWAWGPPGKGNTNAIMETQYRCDLDGTWYDNGKPHMYTYHNMQVFDWTDARKLEGYIDDKRQVPRPHRGNLWKSGPKYFNHCWTGGFAGTYKIKPRIKWLGLGQQPGNYNGDFTVVVTASYWSLPKP
jgi:hypothetical protein